MPEAARQVQSIFVKRNIYKLLLIVVFSLAASLLFGQKPVSAANPTTVNFQGKVVNSNGTNVSDGTYTFVFKLYTVSSGGSAIWTETDSSVSVTSGTFQVNLGASCPFFTANACNGSTPIDFNASNSLYMGITFNSDPAGEMTPRVQFQSVPYAFNADKVGGVSASGLVQLASAGQQTGNINISGTINSGAINVQVTSSSALLVQNSGATSTALTVDTTGSTKVTAGNLAVTSLASCNSVYTDSTSLLSCNYGLENHVSQIEVNGHSIAWGYGSSNLNNRFTGVLAGMLHAGEINHAVSGSILAWDDNSPNPGGYYNVFKNVKNNRTSAPYQSNTGIGIIDYGLNDIGNIGSTYRAPFKNALKTTIARYRAGAIFRETSSSVVFGGSGNVDTGAAGIFSNDTAEQLTANGATITITIPSDFPGGSIDLVFFGNTSGGGAVNTFTLDGVANGTLDTRNTNASTNRATPVPYRITGLSAGSHTIVDTLSSMSTAEYFNYWQIESPNPRPVYVLNQQKVLTYAGWAIPFTDTDVNNINSDIQTVVNSFDSSVVYVDVDSAINKQAKYFYADGVHPNDLGYGLIGQTVYSAIQKTPISVSQYAQTSGLSQYDDTYQKIFRNNFDSTTGFQVQNTAGNSLLTADTSNFRLGVNASYTAMGVPSGLASSPIAGGSLTAGAYKYEVTAIDATGAETTVSNEVTGTTASTNLTNSLTWTAVTGASGYKVYRSAISGAAGTEKFLTSVLANSYKDTGSVTLGTANPPTANSALTSVSFASNSLQLSVGGNGSPTGQFYVSGNAPLAALGTVATTTNPQGVSVLGRYAYVISNGSGTLNVYDVSNPATPTLVGSASTGGGSTPFTTVAQSHYVYVTNTGTSNMEIFDVSNPAAPTLAGTVPVSQPTGVYVQGRYAYVTSYNGNTLYVFDISNPANITTAGSISTNINAPYSVFVQGRYAYIANNGNSTFTIYDVSNPASPSYVGTGTAGLNPSYVAVQDRYAYVANYGANNMQIFDISNPSAPVSLSTVAGNLPLFISLQGRYAYAANAGSGVVSVYDVSNPANPAAVGNITAGTPYSFAVQGRYAYVADHAGNAFNTYDLGGTYSQSLEAGSAETGSLAVTDNAIIAGNLSVASALQVGQGAQINGNFGVLGTANFISSTNSTTAFQVQNASSEQIFSVDTTTTNLLTNPGFETGATGWAGSGTGASCVQNTATKNRVYFGLASLKCTTATSGNTTATVSSFTSTVAAGSYEFSFFAMGDNAATISSVTFTGGAGTCTLNNTSITTTGFQRYFCSITTTGTTTAIVITTGTNSAVIYLDSVQLVSGSTLTPYQIGAIQLRGVINNPITFQGLSNSTAAFQVQNTSSQNILTVDTYNNQVTLGTGAGTAATVLVLGTKTDSGDPATCTTGAIYYNSNSNLFRACQNGTWIRLINAVTVNCYVPNGVSLGSCTAANSSSWSLPAGVSISAAEVIAVGGGGGGGGGQTGATLSARGGGAGGGGGAYAAAFFSAADLGATVTVTPGAGGSAGAAAGAGGTGGSSTFGTALSAFGGAGGTSANGGLGGGGGGTAAAGAGQVGGNPLGAVASANAAAGSGAGGGASLGAGGNAEYGGGGGGGGASGTTATTGGGGGSLHGGGGGGGGAGCTALNGTDAGAKGGLSGTYAAGTGAAIGAAGGNGNTTAAGGGGGGGLTPGCLSGIGTAGGGGGIPGGAGGGGAAGVTGGAGGAGGAGAVWVISW